MIDINNIYIIYCISIFGPCRVRMTLGQVENRNQSFPNKNVNIFRNPCPCQLKPVQGRVL